MLSCFWDHRPGEKRNCLNRSQGPSRRSGMSPPADQKIPCTKTGFPQFFSTSPRRFVSFSSYASLRAVSELGFTRNSEQGLVRFSIGGRWQPPCPVVVGQIVGGRITERAARQRRGASVGRVMEMGNTPVWWHTKGPLEDVPGGALLGQWCAERCADRPENRLRIKMCNRLFADFPRFLLVPQEGVEPPTKRLEGSCSIH